MQSTITSKYQTTIPKNIRLNLGLGVHDALEWRIDGDKVIVTAVHKDFLRHRNSVTIGAGDIGSDIERAREVRAEKFR